jgi:hypothetical protein
MTGPGAFGSSPPRVDGCVDAPLSTLPGLFEFASAIAIARSFEITVLTAHREHVRKSVVDRAIMSER